MRLAGLFWWQQGRGDTVLSAQNSNGLIFFELLFLAFRSMFVALFTFPRCADARHPTLDGCLKLFPSSEGRIAPVSQRLQVALVKHHMSQIRTSGHLNSSMEAHLTVMLAVRRCRAPS